MLLGLTLTYTAKVTRETWEKRHHEKHEKRRTGLDWLPLSSIWKLTKAGAHVKMKVETEVR